MQCLLVKFQLIVTCLFSLSFFNIASTSDILIIRHGRSRSRHSTQKSHVQWGLKALDNLTLVENQDGSLEFSEVESNNELNILNLYVNNTINTQSQSSELNGTIGSFEINFTHNPDPLKGDEKSGKKQTNFVDWLKSERTTEIPKSSKKPNLLSSLSSSSFSPSSLPSTETADIGAAERLGIEEKIIVPTTSKKEQRKNPVASVDVAVLDGGEHEKEKKEEIMLNIKNTVDKGIQYLKSHENLNEIKIEINDFHHDTEFNNAAKNREREQHNKIPRSQFIPVSIKMDKPSLLSSSSHLSNPASLSAQQQQQQQQQRLKIYSKEAQQAKEIKINGGKELGIVTILTTQSHHHDEIENIFPHRHPQGKQKQLKSHQSHSSLASSLLDMSQQQQQQQQQKRMKNRQLHINKPNQLESSFADVFYIPSSTEEPMLGDQPISYESESSPLSSSNERILSTSKTIESKDSTTRLDKSQSQTSSEQNSTSHSDTFQHDLVSSQMTDKIDKENENEKDEEEERLNNGYKNNNNINNIQNDGEVNIETENIYDVEEVEGEPIEVEEFEFDLDLDETSKKNRKNLKRGRDVVTQFLQIVESQHVLGGNCTAGTALNLGEGVVDRYAQDRFRVEAEVAVNRANMLTR